MVTSCGSGFVSFGVTTILIIHNNVIDNGTSLNASSFRLLGGNSYAFQNGALGIDSFILTCSCILNNFAGYGFGTSGVNLGFVILTALNDGEIAVFVDLDAFDLVGSTCMVSSKRGNLQETDTHGQDQDQRLQTFGRVLHDTFSSLFLKFSQ